MKNVCNSGDTERFSVESKVIDVFNLFYEPVSTGIVILSHKDDFLYANSAYSKIMRITDYNSVDHVDFMDFVRKKRNNPVHTVRVVPDTGSEIILFRLLRSDFTYLGAQFECLTLIPLQDTDSLVRVSDRKDLIFDEIRIYGDGGFVRFRGDVIPFSATEFKLFFFLASNAEKAFLKGQLLSRIWNQSALNTRTVDIYIGRIRKKLATAGCQKEYIKTLHGQGYLFSIER
ncbi:helix-turn-helix domain-containing protein [Myxococcota bacterium]|nr:helix-turn-helix domain-containing protein [Myxococcota bacterium]MBU1380583.1 helix-turn-helix domain-containing protein [Myxococcota bacterium]MBU1497161.1 helix-turn-helix domain-containing protein [Myxococcota bacterium]